MKEITAASELNGFIKQTGSLPTVAKGFSAVNTVA